MPTADFPPAEAAPPPPRTDIARWRELVARTLKDRPLSSLRSATRDGIPIEPLYLRRQDAEPLSGRGARPWIVVQGLDDPDPDRVNGRALAAVKGGATGLSLRLASPDRRGLPPHRGALQTALQGVDLAAIQVRIEPHPEGLKVAQWLKEMVALGGLAPELARLDFGLNPVAVSQAGISPDPSQFAATFLTLRNARFRGSLACVDGRLLHEEGATEAQQLGAVLASAVWWLRVLEGDGVPPEEVLPFLGASISVNHDVFVSIAKLRALQLLWARLQELCATPPTALTVHAETSRSMLAREDVVDNLLRNTLAAFAAGVGGATSISVLSHTESLGIDDRNARELARNIHHLLMLESDLHRVVDPAAGSGAIEALTDAFAECGWEALREIERNGGILRGFWQGQAQSEITKGPRSAALAREVGK